MEHETFRIALCISLLVIIVLMAVLTVKNFNALEQRSVIINAIFGHDIGVKVYEQIGFDIMEPYEKTLFRIWDWGYTRIVPPEVFEKIKPYIERC